MRVDARFPVFVKTAIVPRYSSLRPVVYIASASIEICETDDLSLPVALEVFNTNQNNVRGKTVARFRHDGHAFFRPCAYDQDEIVSIFANPFSNLPCFVASRRTVVADAKDQARETLPRGIVRAMQIDDGIAQRFGDFFAKQDGRIELVHGAEEAVERARHAFEDACRSLVIVRGSLWHECPEPFVAVDVNQRPGRMRCVSAALPNGPQDLAISDRPGIDEVLFTVTEIDEARRLSKASFDPGAPWRGYREFGLDVHAGHMFSQCPPVGDAAAMLAKVAVLFPGAKGEFERETEAFLQDEGNWTDAALLSALEDALENIPRNERWKAKGLAQTIARLEARPIDIPSDKAWHSPQPRSPI